MYLSMSKTITKVIDWSIWCGREGEMLVEGKGGLIKSLLSNSVKSLNYGRFLPLLSFAQNLLNAKASGLMELKSKTCVFPPKPVWHFIHGGQL